MKFIYCREILDLDGLRGFAQLLNSLQQGVDQASVGVVVGYQLSVRHCPSPCL
jgi:hypothetical protein